MYYEKDIKKDLRHLMLHPFFWEWFNIVKDVLSSDEFQRRKLFPHHVNCSVWDHSIQVSYDAFRVAKRLNADERVCAIAGLLHDFYEHAYIYNKELEEVDFEYVKLSRIKKSFFKKHGFTHAKEAAKNYIKYFPELEDEVITDCIKCHMFPLNKKAPKYKEGWIITLIDKKNSFGEVINVKEFVLARINSKKIKL